MRLVVVLSRFPFPLEKGDKLRAYHQLKELARRHEIHLVCLTDKKVTPEQQLEISRFCKRLYIFRLNPVLIYWNTLMQFFGGKPYQVGYFYQHRIQRRINRIIEQTAPDHIYCQLVRTAEYVKNIQHIPKTIDYMDALGKGMFRRAEQASGIRKRLFSEEGKRLSEYENRIFDYFNHHTIISEQDRQFINHQQRDSIVVVENGISEQFFSFEGRPEKEYDLVFTGNMRYPPNVESAEYIVREILPLLRKTRPGAKVLLSGADPHPKVSALAGPGVTVTGWVDDIRESYARGKLFVAPLFIGTGLQNKLLEAMAMGIPCITTRLSQKAFGDIGEELLPVAGNASEFADKIEALLNDPAEYKRISKEARDYVARAFSWQNSVAKLERLLEPQKQD